MMHHLRAIALGLAELIGEIQGPTAGQESGRANCWKGSRNRGRKPSTGMRIILKMNQKLK